MGNIFSVLIIDDEIRVTKLLRYLIDWESMGLNVIDFVHETSAAIDIIEKQQPDIVITDISMPDLDGIELIERVHELSPQTSCIVISGYNKFEYAKEALQLGVIDYLNKPIKANELINALEKAMDQKRKKAREKDYISRLENDINNLKAENRKTFLKSIVNGENAAHMPLGELDLGLPDFMMLVIRLDGMGEVAESAAIENYYCDKIQRKLESVPELCPENILLLPRFPDFVVLLNTEKDIRESIFKELYHLIYELKNKGTEAKGIHATVGVSCLKNCGRVDFNKMYDEAVWSVKQRIYDGPDKIIFFEESGKTETDGLTDGIYDKFYKAFKERNSQRPGAILENVRYRLEDLRPIDGSSLYELSEKLCSSMIHAGEAAGLEKESSAKLGVCFAGGLRQSFTEGMVFDCLTQLHRAITEQLMMSDRRELHSISLAKDYVKQHYAEEISLQDMGDYLGLNPTYFSRLFKQEAGETFLEYLTNFRIDKAKSLLEDHQMVLIDIASSVGYKDEKYFSRVFKKTTGLSPKEYRRLYY